MPFNLLEMANIWLNLGKIEKGYLFLLVFVQLLAILSVKGKY